MRIHSCSHIFILAVEWMRTALTVLWKALKLIHFIGHSHTRISLTHIGSHWQSSLTVIVATIIVALGEYFFTYSSVLVFKFWRRFNLDPKKMNSESEIEGASSSSTGGKAERKRKRHSDRKTLAEIALSLIHMQNGKPSCAIDSGSCCQYQQKNIDVGNFIRHFRTQHFDLALANGLINIEDVSAKKERVISKRMVAIDKQLLMDSLLRMLTFHNLPMRCFQWEGFKQLIDPIASAVGVTINTVTMIDFLNNIAQRMREQISTEMKGRLISLKIDSASRQNRHILGINVQYAINDKVVIRTLGM